MSAVAPTPESLKQINAAKASAFLEQNSKLKNKKKKHRKEAAPEVADVVAGSAAGMHADEVAMAIAANDGRSDSHFSKIVADRKHISLAAARKTHTRANKNKKKGAKPTKVDTPITEEFLNVLYSKVPGGASQELKMEISSFVLGTTSMLDWEGTLAKKKADKSHENVRGDCYFLAILWAGLLEGRNDEDGLSQEQQECLQKIYEIATLILELMFDAPQYEKFRLEAIDKAQDNLRQDYIDKSEVHRGNVRAILSPSEIDEIEDANPELVAQMLVEAKRIFLENANQYPGRPEPEDLQAGHKTAQMVSARQKCYPFKKDQFDKERDAKKKFEPLPGVKSNYENWPRIQAEMTGSNGRRDYNPVLFANATTGQLIPRPPVELTASFTNEAGVRVTEAKKYPDPNWNPTVRKTVRTVDRKGRVVDEKIVNIVSLVTGLFKFTPYVGPEQYGVRMTMTGVLSIVDHVPMAQRIITTTAKYARSYDFDDVHVVAEPPKKKIQKINDDESSSAVDDDESSDSDSKSTPPLKSVQQNGLPPPQQLHQQEENLLPTRDPKLAAKAAKHHNTAPVQQQQPIQAAVPSADHGVARQSYSDLPVDYKNENPPRRSRHALTAPKQEQPPGVPTTTTTTTSTIVAQPPAEVAPPRRHAAKTSATPTKTPSSPSKVAIMPTAPISTAMAVDAAASNNSRKRSHSTRDEDAVVEQMPPQSKSRHAIQIPQLNEESSSSEEDDDDEDEDEETEEDEESDDESSEASAPPPPPQSKTSDKHKTKKAKTVAATNGAASSTLQD